MNWREWQPGCWTLFSIAAGALLAVALIYTLGAP